MSHSFSKRYFSDKFLRENIKDSAYQNFEISDVQLIEELISQNQNLVGFNVTIPYKETIIPFLDVLDAAAAEIGAVNTVCISKSADERQILKGYNTDLYGFKQSVLRYLTGNEKKALVFGNGGASKAVVQVLKSLKINYSIVSRANSDLNKNIITYSQLTKEDIKKTNLLVNTTPIGMWPNDDKALEIPYYAITEGTIAYDLIYNPEETLFMKNAKKYGAIVTNGLEMLELQAERAWKLFNLEE